MSSYCNRTTTKSKRKRRKHKDRPCLEFVESPIEKFGNSVDYVTGEPIEFPTIKIDCQSSTQWVSPQIRKSERLKVKRGSKNKATTRVDATSDFSTILEYEEEREKSKRRTTRSYSRKLDESSKLRDSTTPKGPGTTSQFDISTPGSKDNSPIAPSCLSTPEIICEPRHRLSRPSSTPTNSMHYLFQAKTPVLRDVVVLVENTPF